MMAQPVGKVLPIVYMMLLTGLLASHVAQAETSQYCSLGSFEPRSSPNGDPIDVIIRTDCSTSLGSIWCFFGTETPTRALTFNATHIVCTAPGNLNPEKVRFGISGSGEPIQWSVFRYGGLPIDTYTPAKEAHAKAVIDAYVSTWPEQPAEEDYRDSESLVSGMMVKADKNEAVRYGGPAVAMTVEGLDFENMHATEHACVWVSAQDWTVLARTPARIYSPDQLVCGNTPPVSETGEALLYATMNGSALRGPGIPFRFLDEAPTTETRLDCSLPDGLCSASTEVSVSPLYLVE